MTSEKASIWLSFRRLCGAGAGYCIESPFAAVRLRTDAAKRYKKVANAEALIWKIMIAEKKFRRLDTPHLLGEVYKGKKFVNGVAVKRSTGGLPPDLIYTPLDMTSESYEE